MNVHFDFASIIISFIGGLILIIVVEVRYTIRKIVTKTDDISNRVSKIEGKLGIDKKNE